jgi:hypothetical protein
MEAVEVKKTLSILIALLALAGCGGLTDPEPFVPTAAPTRTATSTPTPTITPSPTLTRTPTPLPTPTGSTPTEVFGPTTTPHAEATRQPSTLVPGTLEIEYFVTSSADVAPGDNVTLLWSIIGADEAKIYRLDAEGARTRQYWPVDNRGRLTVATQTTDLERAQFSLVIGEGEDALVENLVIPLTGCIEPWFFEPAPEICSAGAVEYTQAAEQPFERGLMLWVQSEDSIYVVFSDGQQPAWVAVADAFVEGETPESSPEFVPPAEGLIQPVRGFGLVWRNDESIRSRLGWATLSEVAFDGAVQAGLAGEGTSLYMRSARGTILSLSPGGAAWEEIGAAASDAEP